MDTPIVDFVRGYAQSGTSRLHMPGHKGQSLLGFESLDLTEIRGADELYEPEGIIAQSEANATRLFGTQHTYYSTEGSSQCIRAMLCLALQAAPRTGKRPVLLAARNAHKALLYAAALLDFDIRWLWPAAENAGALCSCPISAQMLTTALQELTGQGSAPFGVYVTSPDYLGGMQDIRALSAVCDTFGMPLLVDNAHGAYLRFLPGEPLHPIALGAAMCCDSAHKTLPVVTGGAYLHLGENAPVQEEAAVRGALALFGSTSPSYLILQSLDACNRQLTESYPAGLQRCCSRLSALRGELNAADASFTDVAGDSWYAPFVRWGYAQGVTAGMGDGSFAPEQSVTRQQLLVMLHSFARQYLKLEPTGAADLSIYGDGGQVADWARDAVSWAVSAGLIVPSGEGTLRPADPASRAEVAVILMKFSSLYL